MEYKIKIDPDRCKDCGQRCIAAESCPLEIIKAVKRTFRIRWLGFKTTKTIGARPSEDEDCIGCEACVEVCEADAIVISEG